MEHVVAACHLLKKEITDDRWRWTVTRKVRWLTWYLSLWGKCLKWPLSSTGNNWSQVHKYCHVRLSFGNPASTTETMNWNTQRWKFILTILLLELTMLWMFALFVDYDSEADAQNWQNSFDPIFGGLSPDKNKLRKYYNSKPTIDSCSLG